MVNVQAYTQRVQGFGRCVRNLRKSLRLSGAAMARTYLAREHEPATKEAIQKYVDQLSKLEREEKGTQNPTMARLEWLAKGFGFGTMSEFFLRLEALAQKPPIAGEDVPPAVLRVIGHGEAASPTTPEAHPAPILTTNARRVVQDLVDALAILLAQDRTARGSDDKVGNRVAGGGSGRGTLHRESPAESE